MGLIRVIHKRLRTFRNRRLSARYLHGEGIELGALHNPQWVTERARVRYVDRLTLEEIRQHYPELSSSPVMTAPDIIDDAQTLATVADGSQDFVISNHVLEHLPDPVLGLVNKTRVLKPSGILFLTVPDKRYCFDKPRPLTPLSHLMADYNHRTEAADMPHYEEWACLVEGLPQDAAGKRAEELARQGYAIHFHVWDSKSLRTFLNAVLERHIHDCVIRKQIFNRYENTVIIQKRG